MGYDEVYFSELLIKLTKIPTKYSDRAEGSESKLSTFKDGARILKTIIVLMKEYKPLYFFGFIGFLGMLFSIFLFLPVFFAHLKNPEISLVPTAVLSTGIMLIAMLTFTAGVILDSIRRFRAEVKRMFYNLTK